MSRFGLKPLGLDSFLPSHWHFCYTRWIIENRSGSLRSLRLIHTDLLAPSRTRLSHPGRVTTAARGGKKSQ